MPLSFQDGLKFQTKPETRLDEFDFIGGLVTDAHETKLEPNQSPDIENVSFNQTGSIKTRNGYLRYNNDPVGAASDEANTGASTGTLTIDAEAEYVAQTFQVGTQASLTQIDMWLAMTNSGEQQYMRVELWSGSTGPSTLLSEGQILLVSGTSETEYNFRFRVPYTLAATTEYAIVLRPFVRVSDTDVSSVAVHRTGTAYGSGSVYSSTDSGASWSAVSSIDLKFDVLTGGATGGSDVFRYYGLGGLQQMFAKFSGTLYRGNDQTGATTAITLGSGVTLDSGYLDTTVANGTLLLCDGVNYIQKYNGSTNSNYSTGTLTATEDSATITGSGTTWNTSTNAEVGEYIKLPDGKWYKITAIASNTSLTIETTYQASTASGQTYVISPWGEIQGALGTATAPTGLIRPTPDFLANHANRIWALEGNTLYFSALDTSITEEHFNDFDTVNNAGTIIVTSADDTKCTGLYSLNGVLYIFQRRAIWGLYGTSPTNFELRNITNEIGVINKRSLVEYNDLLLFLSDRGVYMFDGTNLKNITDGVISESLDNWANKTSPTAILWDNSYLLAYTPDGASYNTQAICYDLTREVWTKFTELNVGDLCSWSSGSDNGEIYFVSSNQGSIYRWAVGGHDDGYEIRTYYSTPSLGFGANVNDKTIKKFYIQQKALGNYEMLVQMYININSGPTSSTINLGAGTTALFDVALFDEAVFSTEGDISTNRIGEFQGIAKFYKFIFIQDGYDEGIEILGVTVTERIRRLS